MSISAALMRFNADLRPLRRRRGRQHPGGTDEKLCITNRSLMSTERINRCQGRSRSGRYTSALGTQTARCATSCSGFRHGSSQSGNERLLGGFPLAAGRLQLTLGGPAPVPPVL